jgi:GNAT superfamily N-acetyltransferase
MVTIRPAESGDAPAMAALLNAIIERGGSTAHQSRFDARRMLDHYIVPPLAISCHVSLDKGEVIGFQALEWADPAWPGAGKLPEGWAIIASFVAPAHQGRGVGQALFAATLAAARRAGVLAIDATIRADNRAGLAYYGGLGFADYDVLRGVPLGDGTPVDRIRKRFDP